MPPPPVSPPGSTGKTLFGYPLEGLVHLLFVYIIWGATFLAIRVAVMEGAGWDPFSMAGARLFVAGLVLLGITKLRGERVLPRGIEWVRLAAYALFIWVVGHGIVVWAEEEISSGQAALIVGTAPIWGTIYEAFLDRRPPGWRMIGGLLLGVAGLILLIQPDTIFVTHETSPRLLVVILGTVSWSGGVVLQSRRRVGLSAIASSGWQQLLASAGFAVLFFSLEDKIPAPSVEAWIAWGFLVVFGSLIAFTSYVIMVKLLPTPLVLTHAYVNPTVAVLLGWLLLDEQVSWPMLLGAIMILAGVGGVIAAKRRWRSDSPPPGTAASGRQRV